MTMNHWMKAALLGLAVASFPLAPAVMSEELRVVKNGTAATLDVPMNRAVVVESDVPFSELSIANPGIADISSLSDRPIYVLGKSPGITTLTLLDGTGRLITNVEVKVAADVTEFKERLRQILPGEKIEVRTANDGMQHFEGKAAANDRGHLQHGSSVHVQAVDPRKDHLLDRTGDL